MTKIYGRESFAVFTAIGLGVFSFATILSIYNIADGDLWARLVQGASIWKTGRLIYKDIFAFTPVLPLYVDHEWGAGLIFFSLLKLFGPGSLLLFKIIIALGTLGFALAAARLNGIKWPAVLMLAIPCALTLFPGYVPVVRSHVLTYLLFAATLFYLEKIQKGSERSALAIIFIMLLWVNVHGGFVSGLGMIGIYVITDYFFKRSSKSMLVILLGAVLATTINPYGMKFWSYLWPALTLGRSSISEWSAMPLFGADPYFGFRVLFAIVIFILIFGRMGFKGKNAIPRLAILAVTAYLAIRHRRHAPFFGIAALAFLGPYFEACIDRLRLRIPVAGIAALYALTALLVASYVLPAVTFQVLAPVGVYPVREADILMYSKAEGNVVVPLRWGNYVMWRLYPRVKISMCGRYEAMYPKSTFDMNHDFFFKNGKDWDRIIRNYKVDYVLLELNNTALTHEDLKKLGLEIVWQSKYSALYAKREHLPALSHAARYLPPVTIEPLDARIPDAWPM
ncbi:MAG: hypothetical protein Q8Q87_01630 [Candidatus Omnitrophota bacterium]|nr:hypothetical protein [Candidatus Omnitrophota bacterium]